MDDEIQEIIDAYDELVLGIDKKASSNRDGRAYGGIIRSGKGKLVESIADTLIKISWKRLGQKDSRLITSRDPFEFSIKKSYIKKLKHEEVRKFIEGNIGDYVYRYIPDVLVSIDNKPVISIECKAYTENAMIKRILVDATLMKQKYPKMSFVLFQLESQLGGDYSELNKIAFGSPSTHTLLSNFDIDLNIITLLKGERKVDRPIHKKEFFKPLARESLKISMESFEEILKRYR